MRIYLILADPGQANRSRKLVLRGVAPISKVAMLMKAAVEFANLLNCSGAMRSGCGMRQAT
jgi:hypothetical protein